ncbi:MAG: hypothetical protein MI862_26045 [Desulfobacterales bacterium]|nr:hypothetical protein [Desulfobacterales bacterium]
MSESTEMLRNFAAAHPVLKRNEARKALGLTCSQVTRSIETLVRQGFLIRIGHGLYQTVSIVEKPACEVTTKVWRAMKVKRVFSYADIAKLAQTSKEYLYKLFRAYKADGYIKNAGINTTRTVKGYGTEKLFRLTIKGQNKARQPNISEFKIDPLTNDAIELNRLVCSRLVVRDEKAALDAVTICERIIETLKADMER